MKRVLLLLCDGVEILEAAAFHDVLGWSGVYGSEAVEVVTASPGPTLRCTFGLRVTPDMALAEVFPESFDALAIPGGFEDFGFYREAYSESVLDLIRRFEAAGKPIASICVGALPLGRSGILKGRKATTYGLLDGRRRIQLSAFGAEVLDEPLVVDGDVATSRSPAEAVASALWLLGRLTGEANARRIAGLMGFGPHGEEPERA